jgi:hypothetical protein
VRLYQQSHFKNDTENIINKGPNTKIDFAYYFPTDNLSNNLEFLKKEDKLSKKSYKNNSEFFKETMQEKEEIQVNRIQKEPENEFDRSYYMNYNEDSSNIYSKVLYLFYS